MVFRRFFVTLPPSLAKTGPQSDIQDSGVSEEQQGKIIYKRYSIQFSLNIRPSYNYLYKMLYIYIYIYIHIKQMGVSAKTAIKQVANNGRYKKEAWQYRELGSAHGNALGF